LDGSLNVSSIVAVSLGLSRYPLEDNGRGVPAGASTGTVADRDLALNRRPCGVDAIAELHYGLSASSFEQR
jgi:hypothetical protein